MDESNALVLMDAQRIQRSLKRIAHQIAEDNKARKEITVLGINERGYAVADMLKTYLVGLSDSDVNCHQIVVAGGSEIEGTPSFQERYLLLVDDVIFSGTTMFKALNKISESTMPDEIHTATLIDRGHRKFPVFAQFTGMELPTKLDEHVDVIVEDKKPERVVLVQSMH